MLEKPSSSTGSRIDRSEWIESGIRAGAIAGMIAIFAGVFYKIGMHESKVPTFPKAAMKPITPGPSSHYKDIGDGWLEEQVEDFQEPAFRKRVTDTEGALPAPESWKQRILVPGFLFEDWEPKDVEIRNTDHGRTIEG
ncbi:MAG: hypothetical protein AAB489_00290 [Patescibacteria group bacterium]|mgnify:CR=1 FL=1